MAEISLVEGLQEEEIFTSFEINSFFVEVMEFQLLLLILLFLRFLEEKTSLFRERDFPFNMFNMLNMFRNFRDELFQPFIVHFKESLPAILRILTWDLPNPYGGFSECLPLGYLFLICES